MLAKLGREPFDSDQHLFEVKWDGFRAVAFADGGAWRLRSRNRTDFVPRYPELAFLGALEPGLVLDGEIVVFREARPDFAAMLTREQARAASKIEYLARTLPCTYVAFDVLYRDFEPLFELPLVARREILEEVLGGVGEPRLLLSEGVVGAGTTFFDELQRLDLEGMVAKRLDSRYLPGRRTDAWTKIKRVRSMHCVILGYLPEGQDELRSLVVGAEENGVLRCVGRVGSGLTRALRLELRRALDARRRPAPVVDCGMQAEWVEPGLFCTVSYLERTKDGLRAPVFVDLIRE
jgi:DNA ligase D-like protein (predicted ligase)